MIGATVVTNAEKYFFADFTRDNFRRLVKLAKEHFVFRTFSEFRSDERFVLWRHDVDLSPQAARRLAQIERDEGVRATFFVHLHSDFYNPFERAVVSCLEEIISLGHEIGLHFETDHYGIGDEAGLETHLSRERAILRDVVGVDAQTFSFHNPNPFAGTCVRERYAGMINVYSRFFREEVDYCSDSNGYWRHARLEDVLRSPSTRPLQVLTHPAWWQDSPMSPAERIRRCIDGRGRRTLERYERTLAVAGRTNVDGQ